MLNEILEFEAYVKSPESEKPRIQPKLLTNNFSEDGNLFGIERILIVIARGYIFSKCHQNEIYNSDGMEINFWSGTVLMITKENEKNGIFLNACGEIQTRNQLWKFIVKRKDGNLSKWL